MSLPLFPEIARRLGLAPEDVCPVCDGRGWCITSPLAHCGASGFPCTFCGGDGTGASYRTTKAAVDAVSAS